MRRYTGVLIALLLVVLAALVAWAGTESRMQEDVAGRPIPVICPKGFTIYSTLGGTYSFNQSAHSRLKITPTAAVQAYYSSATGSLKGSARAHKYPLTANTPELIGVNQLRSHIIFVIPTAETKTHINIQYE